MELKQQMARIDQIRDSYIKINGLAEGSSVNRYYWDRCLPDNQLSEQEAQSICFFQEYARELILNIEDAGIKPMLNLSAENQDTIRVRYDGFPGKHRAKGIFLDFRHFVATGSPCEYKRICNLIKKSFKAGSNAQVHIELIKNKFLNGRNEGLKLFGKSFSQRELIDVWFNTKYFHANDHDKKTPKRNEIEIHLYADDVVHLLLFCIMMNLNALKSVYTVIKDFSFKEQVFNLPDDRFLNKQE